MKTWLVMFGSTAATVAILLLIGYWPTRQLSGGDGLRDMFAACALTLLTSWASLLPLMFRRPDTKFAMLVLVSMTVRFALVAVGALAMVLLGWVQRGPFLVWVALSYVLLLVPDTLLAVSVSNDQEKVSKNSEQ